MNCGNAQHFEQFFIVGTTPRSIISYLDINVNYLDLLNNPILDKDIHTTFLSSLGSSFTCKQKLS